MVRLTDIVPAVAKEVDVMPRLATPEYSSMAQLAALPADMVMVRDFEATEPLAAVDQISDLTAVPLATKACRAQTDPLSLIELIEDVVFPKAHTATTVLPLPEE